MEQYIVIYNLLSWQVEVSKIKLDQRVGIFSTYFILYYIIKNNFVLCAVSKKSGASLILS